MVYKCVYLYQYKTKNIFAATYSVPLLFLSGEEDWGEKILRMKNILQKIRNA